MRCYLTATEQLHILITVACAHGLHQFLSLLTVQDVEIDIELAPGDQTSLPKTKEQAERDAGNQLHMLTNRHDKFLDSLREVKVSSLLNICYSRTRD